MLFFIFFNLTAFTNAMTQNIYIKSLNIFILSDQFQLSDQFLIIFGTGATGEGQLVLVGWLFKYIPVQYTTLK